MINSVISLTVSPKRRRDAVFRWWAVRNVATMVRRKNASSARVYCCQTSSVHHLILTCTVHVVTTYGSSNGKVCVLKYT